MPEADLDLLTDAARAAGKVAMGFFRSDPDRWDKPDEQGPVTEADLAVDKLLRETLGEARPDYGWLSEETPDHLSRLDRDRVFIVDPIDGTRAYIEGATKWAHSLAIVDQGRVVTAVVYLPAEDLMFAADLGGGATLNGSPIRASGQTDIDGARVLAAKPVLQPYQWKNAVVPPIDRQYRPSLAYRMAATAEGQFDAMMTLRATWEWDVAAGALLIEEAGGLVTNRKGAPLAFNRETPQLDGVVAGTSAIQRDLVTRLL